MAPATSPATAGCGETGAPPSGCACACACCCRVDGGDGGCGGGWFGNGVAARGPGALAAPSRYTQPIAGSKERRRSRISSLRASFMGVVPSCTRRWGELRGAVGPSVGSGPCNNSPWPSSQALRCSSAADARWAHIPCGSRGAAASTRSASSTDRYNKAAQRQVNYRSRTSNAAETHPVRAVDEEARGQEVACQRRIPAFDGVEERGSRNL